LVNCAFDQRAAPLINLSTAQHMKNCAIFGQSRTALTIGLGLDLHNRPNAQRRLTKCALHNKLYAGGPRNMPSPLSSLCGRPKRLAPPSRPRLQSADRNVAVCSHGQYVHTLTAAAAWRVNTAVSKTAWWPWPLTFDVESGVRVTCEVGYLCGNLLLRCVLHSAGAVGSARRREALRRPQREERGGAGTYCGGRPPTAFLS